MWTRVAAVGVWVSAEALVKVLPTPHLFKASWQDLLAKQFNVVGAVSGRPHSYTAVWTSVHSRVAGFPQRKQPKRKPDKSYMAY